MLFKASKKLLFEIVALGFGVEGVSGCD